MIRGATKVKDPGIQPKLKIGRPDDRFEQEADAVADQVTKMPTSRTPAIHRKHQDGEEEELMMKALGSANTDIIHKKVAEGEAEQLQRKGPGNPVAVRDSLPESLRCSKGSGQPMDNATQTTMRRSMGTDFPQVRIHTGPSAVKMNRQLESRAFTHGKDIYFNRGEYKPDSPGGKHLLAHELTHVLQQGTAQNRIQCYPGTATLPKALEGRVDRGIKKMKNSKETYLVEIAEALTTGIFDIAVPDFFDTSSFAGDADACPISQLKPISFSEASNRKQLWEQGTTSGWETRNWIARVPGTNILLPLKKGVDAYTRQFGSYDGVIYLFRNPRLKFLDLIIHEAIHLRNPLAIAPGDPGSYREKFLSELRAYYYGDYRNVKPDEFRFLKAVTDAENETAYLTGEGISINAAVVQKETWKRAMGRA